MLSATILEHWLSVARQTPLGILSDLDGTLIPFAPTPEEARPDPELHALLHALSSAKGVRVAIVSGRSHHVLERYFPDPAIWLVAEHGAWCRGEGAWEPTLELDAAPIQRFADRAEVLASRHGGARIERKTWSVALHHRQMRAHERTAFIVEACAAIDVFLAEHPSFERIDGDHVIEVRAAAARKSFAVSWMRQHGGADVRLVAIGDDLTDEHMFGALDPLDEAVLVRSGMPRRSAARWVVDSVDEARRLLGFLRDVRAGKARDLPPVAALEPSRPSIRASDALLVVSNRLPDLRSSSIVAGERRTGRPSVTCTAATRATT